MKVLDPQSALLTNAEVFQFLQTNPPRAAEKQIGSYPTTNLGGHATIRKDFERYASEITPFVRDHAAVDGWVGEVVRRLKPFELTKTEVLNLVNMGVGTRGATAQKGEEEEGGEGEGEGEEEVDEEAVMGRDVQFFKVAVEEAEERFPGEEGEERIREVVSILKEIIQAKNETEPTRINGK